MENLKLTPFHPIMRGADGEAQFPIACAAACEPDHDGYVYDLVLRNRGVVASPLQSLTAEGDFTKVLFAATFGHNVTKGCFAHAYFGSERVVEDLKTHPRWSSGLVTLERYTFVRASEEEGRVVVGMEFERDSDVVQLEMNGLSMITA